MLAVRAWLLLLLLSPALASAELLRLVADPWPPFNDRDLPGNGLASDLVEQALKRAGYTTSYAEVPWERAVLGLKRGDYDVLINAWYSADRAEYGYFSRPYLVNRLRFMQRKGSNIRFETLADLYPHSIAVVRGYAYSKEFDSDPNLLKVGVGSFEIAARMLHAGRVQLALEDELVARYHMGRELSSIRGELEFLPLPLTENGLHILVRRSRADHEEIASRFDKAIQEMSDDGSYAATLQRHGP
ncbi:ABC transporter substrate-binding protein [Ectopseudomonas mendocina]|uniref:Amino acid ABC transporter substrate-binding protein n=1 Tax=Ectopseudomonas mendocina TaxID=300 RepID=A0A2R3QLL3_ECTME|nr:transporter substrate-binding domain-containing protein [Pseudomonas mendocina]AVO52660.1 amino acid ABC transporter substrate-binding protein [Pseudomonas mendocina]